jgi:mono/diheme cytochrome c family protein
MKQNVFLLRVGFLGFLFLSVSSCQCDRADSTKNAPLTAEETLVNKGRLVYQANCSACHNSNVKVNGSQGPALFGSSIELLTAKTLNGVYPEGYTPKRSTGLMPKLPHLKNDIDALHAFINAAQ